MNRLRMGLLAAAAVASAAPAALAQDAYVVGLSAAITGRGSETYAPVVEAIGLYVDQVNEEGGINGHPVRLLIEDNRAQPSKAAADAKQFLNQDEVILVMNASLSSTYAPMVAETRRAGVPLFFAGAVCPPDVYPPAEELQFCSTSFGARYDSRFALGFVKETAEKPVKLGLVAMAIPVSRGEIDYAEELAGSMGMEAVDKESIPPPTPDYAPFATKLKSAGANWVYSWAPWVTQVKTLEALRKLGWEGNYIAYAHINAEEELKRLKDDKFYVFGANAFFQDGLGIHQEIRAAAEEGGASYPATYLAEGWVAAMALEQALSDVSWPPSREKMAAAMNSLKVDMRGLRGGPLEWTGDNHFRTTQYYRVYRWDSGRQSIVQVQDWTGLEVK